VRATIYDLCAEDEPSFVSHHTREGDKQTMVRAVPRPKKPKHPPKPERPSVPFNMAIRMFLIGSIAVGGCVWALWRHYSLPRAPMLVPMPSASASASAPFAPDEVPVDLEPTK
jgi:hypothetical protein